MTAHVLALQTDAPSTAPGKARSVPVFVMGSRTAKIAVYDLNFGTDVYVTDGYSIASIFTDFPGGVNFIGIEQQDTSTAADRRAFAVDYAAQKIVVYTAVNTEDSGNDIGVVTLRLLVVGNA